MKQSNTNPQRPAKYMGHDNQKYGWNEEAWAESQNAIISDDKNPGDFMATIETHVPVTPRPGPRNHYPSRFAKFERDLMTGNSFLLGDSSKLNSNNEKFRQAHVERLRVDRQSLIAYLKRQGWKVVTRRTEDGNVRFWVS